MNIKEVPWGTGALQVYTVVTGHENSVNLIEFALGLCGFKGFAGF